MNREGLAVLLVLGQVCGCATPPGSEWDAVVARARELRPAVPAGDAAILDGLEARARDQLTSLRHPDDRASWEKAVPKIRGELRRSLGLDRLPEAKPNKIRSVGVLSYDDYRIEKFVYETLPSMEVPAHLYLPAHSTGRIPGILFVPGHWYADSKTRPEFQAFAITMARRGFAVLTYDPFGQGERGISARDHRRTELLAVGVAQEAIVVFESLCALELLLARPEVDSSRVGMTGASGGGFNSWILPALETRIAVTVPVVGTSDFLEQARAVRNVDWFAAKEHCHFIPRLFRYANNHELLACVAPRPVMVISAHNDIGFPVPGQRDVVKYGEALYAALGASGKVGYFEDADEGHGYQKRKREAAYGWFLKWLKGEGDGSPIEEPALQIPAWNLPELRCFPPGKNVPAGPALIALAESILKGAPLLLGGLPLEVGLALGLPSPLPTTVPDLVKTEGRLRTGGTQSAPGPVVRVSWRMPDGVLVPAVFVSAGPSPKGVLVVVGDVGKERMLDHPAVRSAHDSGWAVLAADLRGMGELTVQKPGWVYAMSLMLGENVVGRQSLDLVFGIRALKAEPELRGKPIGLLGCGTFASLSALYAAIFEEVTWIAGEQGIHSFRALAHRPRSATASFALAEPGKERDVVLDAEIPHALVAFRLALARDISDYLKEFGPKGAVWAGAVDGDGNPAGGPASALEFIRLRMEETR